ncbi:MAG TPA: twin-arginine translocase TatA/TatE family subunit [Mucilaginibacter sp.]|jgi:sec-independent protein translocase protein TatA
MGLLEPWHIIIIVFALLLMFGGKKIPELMRGLGKGMKEFKDAQNGDSGSAPTNTTANPTSATDDKPRV